MLGSILIESKNTKTWIEGWISKLKENQREQKADLAVIATVAMPPGVTTFKPCEGVIIVHYSCLIPVVTLLRNQLFEIARAKNYNIGKNEKMEALYSYLTGTEFRQKIESVFEGLFQMNLDLQKEKMATERAWAKREKQIQQTARGCVHIYGGMQGILGSSLPDIKNLEIDSLLIEEDKKNLIEK